MTASEPEPAILLAFLIMTGCGLLLGAGYGAYVAADPSMRGTASLLESLLLGGVAGGVVGGACGLIVGSFAAVLMLLGGASDNRPR